MNGRTFGDNRDAGVQNTGRILATNARLAREFAPAVIADRRCNRVTDAYNDKRSG